ncbi:MAG: hypothetical protein WDO56_08910 [Gammaproteobacteria bacterium]
MADQPKVGLVHQARGIQLGKGGFARELLARQPIELGIEAREQLIAGLNVAAMSALQQNRYVLPWASGRDWSVSRVAGGVAVKPAREEAPARVSPARQA